MTSGPADGYLPRMTTPDEAGCLLAREHLAADCAKMKSLLAGLPHSKDGLAAEIHAIRKLGKSLRGGFTLFRLGKSSAVEIQAIGRLLSGPRDAVSRLNTWNKLGWAGDAGLATAITDLLEQQTHSAARRPPPAAVAWCVDRVDAAMAELQNLPPGHLPERIAAGLDKLEKRTLKRCRMLERGKREEDFHEARKAVKAWLGATGFFSADPPESRQILDQLGEMLGDENDLATLEAWLQGHGFTRHFAPDLWQTIRNARQRLQRKVIRHAARLEPEPRG